MNKKNTILLFLLCLVAAPFFFSVYIIVERKIIECRMEERMECENLQTITVDAASVVWLKTNKELLLNGKPFDVKSIGCNGQNLIISGLYDQWEKELDDQVQDFEDITQKPGIETNSLLLLFFTTNYLPNNFFNVDIFFAILPRQTSQIYQDGICSLYKQIVTPPPRSS